MLVLDKSKPYGLVYGMPGVSYEQDGALFAASGAQAVNPQEIEEPTKPKVTKYDMELQRTRRKRGL